MKKLVTILETLICIFVIYGCTSKNDTKSSILFPKIELDKFNSSQIKMSELLKDYDLIKLETTDESLIGGRFNKIIKQDSSYYVCSINEILIFDANGSFTGKLSKIGNGPDEYEKILDFDIVPRYDEIWISSSKNIIRYKIPSLDFSGKIKLDFYAKKFKYLGQDMFIALTPDEKVFNICSIDGTILESYLDKDLANSGEKPVQFVKIRDLIISQLFNSNSAVCYDIKNSSFSIIDVISPSNDRVITTNINKQYYDKYGYLDFTKEVQDEYIGIIGFRKINNQTIMSLRYPESELAVIIDNGKCVKEYIVNPSDKCPLIDDIFNCQDPLFLMSFASCESDDSFLFMIPNDNPDLNPFLLEVTEFK